MTREEVIKGLSCCQRIGGCGAGCPYNKTDAENCGRDLLSDALKLLESDRESEIKTEVRYKILNREDILREFHEFIFSHVNFFMDAKDENSKSDALSMIIGATILTHNLLNPKIKEEMPDA